jgi:hypothetical protein
MERRHQVNPGVSCTGKQQLQTLASATLHALERAGLEDIVEELKRRVLDRSREDVCDVVQTEGLSLQVSFKPMIELLLYEVKHIARAPHVSDDDRRVRIEWMMTLAGV